MGVDGSAAALTAATWAAHVASALGAELVVVSTLQVPWSEVKVSTYDRRAAERRALLEDEWSRPAVELAVPVQTHLRDGDPREVLLPMAEEVGAELVVLGRTGHGTDPGLFHLGSVVEHAAHHSALPLAVVPVGFSRPTSPLVLGLDGSPGSATAVDWCSSVAPALGASVVAVTIQEPYPEWGLWAAPSGMDAATWRELHHELTTWAAPLEQCDVDVEEIVQPNLHAVDGLLAISSAHRAGALVIGTRGGGGFAGLRIGGVAMKVLHRVSRPLVLVPPVA